MTQENNSFFLHLKITLIVVICLKYFLQENKVCGTSYSDIAVLLHLAHLQLPQGLGGHVAVFEVD